MGNSRYLGKDIYKPDQKPYYGTGVDYKVLSNMPKGMKSVPIELNDLKNTYADPKNIKILEHELERVTKKESLNSISLSGKYIPDAAPYYDPSAAEKRVKAEDISQKIANMKYELTKEKGPVFTEENFKVQTKIQNYANLNREATNEFIKKSYYYEPMAKSGSNPKMTVFNVNEKADTKEHKIVAVDTMADVLGSKYVENTKTKYVEADAKDTSAIKDVTPHIVSNLKKNEIDRKIVAVKVDKVKKIVGKKVEVVKAPVTKVVVPEVKKETSGFAIDFSKGLNTVNDEKKPTA